MAIRGDELLRMTDEDILKLYYGKDYKRIFEEKRYRAELAEKEFNDFMNNPIYGPRAIGFRGCL